MMLFSAAAMPAREQKPPRNKVSFNKKHPDSMSGCFFVARFPALGVNLDHGKKQQLRIYSYSAYWRISANISHCPNHTIEILMQDRLKGGACQIR
jgi:hypothetical protein